jgi:hypothetical protein
VKLRSSGLDTPALVAGVKGQYRYQFRAGRAQTLLYRPLNRDALAAMLARVGIHRGKSGERIQCSAVRARLAADTAGEDHPEKRRFSLRGRDRGDHDSAFVAP